MRPYQVWRHEVGTPISSDVLVLQENDERFELGVELTKSERYIIFTSSSQITSESRYLRSDDPAGEPILFEARRHGVEYSVDHQEDRFLILTNDGAHDFKLVAAPIDRPGREAWTDLVPEREGVRVPLSLVYRRDLARNGTNPTLLYGYGAYELPSDPMFDAARLSLLDRGFIYAIAHVRGCGEMGSEWYEDGKFLTKTNTFDDFIACAVELIDQGYTSPRHLAIRGRSAGGLLIGAVLNARPDLFACAV